MTILRSNGRLNYCCLRQHSHSWLQSPRDPGPMNNLQDDCSYMNAWDEALSKGEKESHSLIHFLYILVIRNETTLTIKFYRKPTHTGRYLNSNSNCPPHVERGLMQSHHNRASTICQERQDLVNRISSLRHDLLLNGYPQGFTDSVINAKGISRLNKEQKPTRK
jgi:hypothetical protein